MEYLFASGLCVRGREKARMFMIIGGPQKCIHELLCGPGLNDDLHAKCFVNCSVHVSGCWSCLWKRMKWKVVFLCRCLSAAFPMSPSLGILQSQEATLHSLEPGVAGVRRIWPHKASTLVDFVIYRVVSSTLQLVFALKWPSPAFYSSSLLLLPPPHEKESIILKTNKSSQFTHGTQ